MNRFLVSLAAAVVMVVVCPGSSRSGADADRAALQAELDKLLDEIVSTSEDGTSIGARLEGRVPDLVMLCSAEVRGEVAPCG